MRTPSVSLGLALLTSLCLARPALAGGDPVPTSAAARWGADYFPNVPLVTHEGKTVRFFDDMLRDKVVVLSFIYTSCPDACPLETAKLTEVAALLGDRVGQDVFMYSISIDPERDTPEVLNEYRARYQTPPGWLFLTGEKADIKLIRQKLGMIASGGEENLKDHTLSLMLGNQATGQWFKRSPMENPYFLATQIGSWLTSWKQPPEPGHDYADAPALRSISRGENLFRTRCMTCHLIGPEDGLKRQGPNLLGVTERRERPWLARWLAEPDVMLAEKDPLALALFEANRNLPMPNMRLNPLEVEELLGYMQDESARIAREMRGAEEPWTDEESESGDDAAFRIELEPTAKVPSCCEKRDELVIGDDAPLDVLASDALVPLSAPVRVAAGEPSVWPERPPAATPTPERAPEPDLAAAPLRCLALALALGALAMLSHRRI